jgi:hypothetical protein
MTKLKGSNLIQNDEIEKKNQVIKKLRKKERVNLG